MELVYLWVENYKNIQKQGFNFSPRFRCDYDENTKELNIVDKNKTGEFYPKNFFGGNVNVTAIVGENGSGKSSLIIFLMKEIFNKSSSKFFIIIEEEGKVELYHNNIDNINTSFSKYDIFDEKIQNKLKNIFFQFIDFSLTNNIINDVKEYKENFSIEPSTDYLGSGPGYTSKISTISFTAIMMGKSVSLYKLIDDELLNNLNIEKFNEIKLSDTRFDKKSKQQNFQKEIDLLNEFYKENPTKYLFKIFDKEKFEKCLEDKNFNGGNKTIKLSDIDDLDLEYLSILDRFVTIELINDKNISYRDLSGGHKIFIGYFALIYKQLQIILREKKKSNFFIIIDEIETALHPKWQKSIMKFLIKGLVKIIENKNISIHFLPITHSPFVISDLPKENVIFLERLENGQCKNISNIIDIKQTFGANIHTLLSHGFFMKNGLMGEFAKEKIQSIIKYHEDIEKKEILETDTIEYKTKKQKEFWQIQSIIGDDYLKQVIKNHLVEIEKIVLGNDEAKEEEIKRLEAQIEQLRNENVKNKIFIKFRR